MKRFLLLFAYLRIKKEVEGGGDKHRLLITMIVASINLGFLVDLLSQQNRAVLSCWSRSPKLISSLALQVAREHLDLSVRY
jgi:hypothetical protein